MEDTILTITQFDPWIVTAVEIKIVELKGGGGRRKEFNTAKASNLNFDPAKLIGRLTEFCAEWHSESSKISDFVEDN